MQILFCETALITYDFIIYIVIIEEADAFNSKKKQDVFYGS